MRRLSQASGAGTRRARGAPAGAPRAPRRAGIRALLLFAALQAVGAEPVPRVRGRSAGGETYAWLRDAGAFYGMEYADGRTKSPRLRSRWSELVFEGESRRLRVNGTLVWLHAPLRVVGGRWALTQTDLRKQVDPLLRPSAYLRGHRARTVLLDPGHGGRDSGAVGPTGLRESAVVLDLASRVRLLLVNEGMRVHMTRDADRFVELADRAARAAALRADVLVSIHLNAAGDPGPRGIETYVLTAPGHDSTSRYGTGTGSKAVSPGHRESGASMVLGFALQEGMRKQAGSTDRGVRRARYAILKAAPCAAALVECGFLSNRRNEKLLRSEWYRNLLARGIADGILAYRRRVEAAAAP